MNEKNLEKKFSKIETHIFDQGGWSECSNCNYDLVEYLRNYFSFKAEDRRKTGLKSYRGLSEFIKKTEMQSPKCNHYLSYGEMTIALGGSDF